MLRSFIKLVEAAYRVQATPYFTVQLMLQLIVNPSMDLLIRKRVGIWFAFRGWVLIQWQISAFLSIYSIDSNDGDLVIIEMKIKKLGDSLGIFG